MDRNLVATYLIIPGLVIFSVLVLISSRFAQTPALAQSDDTPGTLADGTPWSGPVDLRAAVLSRSEAFMTTATEKLFVYALGRPVHYYDMPTIRTVVRRASKEGNRFSALLLGIVESDAFQKRVKKAS